MKIIVDKIEEDIATVELENGYMVNVPLVILDGAKEGDIVEILVKKNETDERKQTIEEIANKLFE